MREILHPKLDYIERTFVEAKESEAHLVAKTFSMELGLDRISLSSSEGAILSFLLKIMGAKTVVEIGTLTGYSALWILQGIGKEGRLISLEKNECHATKASEVFSRYHLNDQVSVLVGDAVQNLQTLTGPFDAVFIDANKAAYLKYYQWAVDNLKKGGILIADNTFLGGSVFGMSTKFSPKQIEVMQEFNRRLGSGEQFKSIMIPTEEGLTVGIKI